VRIAAVRAIRRVTHQPGEIIAIVAGDDDRLVRLAVADALHTLPDPAATALLSDPDLRVREAAARSAGIRQSQLLGQLLSHDPSSDVRHAAARTLGNLQDPQLAETLILGVEDVDAVVRVAVLRALEQLLTHGGAITRLQHELVSARPERRRATVYALAHLKGLEAASELWRLADDPDVPTRLALLQTAEALQPDPEPLLRYLATDPDSTVRLSAENRLLRRDSARA
jgi:HEAT repeat protein